MIFISWWFKFVSYVSIEFTFAEMYLQSPRTTLLNLHLFISPRQDERGQWFCATKTKVWAQLLRLVDKMTGMEIIPSLVEFLDQLHSSFQLQWALCCESSDRVIHALAVAMTRARYRIGRTTHGWGWATWFTRKHLTLIVIQLRNRTTVGLLTSIYQLYEQ